MMPIIDHAHCSRCGTCIEVCSPGALAAGDDGEPIVAEEGRCKLCGHCVAVCPTDGIQLPAEGVGSFAPIGPTPDGCVLSNLLAAKRSVRRYKDEPIERETLERLIQTAAMAPSAHNAQKRAFLVVTDRDRIDEMEAAVIENFRRLLKIMTKPARRVVGLFARELMQRLEDNLPALQRLIRRYDDGLHPVFHHAPCVVFMHSPKSNMLGRDDCVTAQQYLMLQAEALGLGSCMVGYATTSARSLKPLLDLPKSHVLQTATTLGKPAVTYRKTVVRNWPDVRWME
ncbi:MAG: nitroreductase family protein [Phycisphaerae bacterium]